MGNIFHSYITLMAFHIVIICDLEFIQTNMGDKTNKNKHTTLLQYGNEVETLSQCH